MRRVLAALLLAACVPTALPAPASAPSAGAPLTSAPALTFAADPTPLPTAVPRGMPTAADERLIGAIVAFARAPSAGTLAAVPFADRVRLGLSDRLMTERASRDLLRPDAWVLEQVAFRGHVGPYSALDVLAKSGPTVVSVGPHPHCASPPVPPPVDFAASRRVSVQPTGIDTCLLWWTVDLFVSPTGRIEAVTLDLWDP
jgi:hypothetical protein